MQGIFEYRFIQFAFEGVINQHLAIIITDIKIIKSLCPLFTFDVRMSFSDLAEVKALIKYVKEQVGTKTCSEGVERYIKLPKACMLQAAYQTPTVYVISQQQQIANCSSLEDWLHLNIYSLELHQADFELEFLRYANISRNL
jgi:hypothetical protein